MKEPTSCGHCKYDEAEGGLLEQCAECKETDRSIVVCASCLQASCWQGIFYCDDYRDADVKEMTIGELRKLGREHPSYWAPERNNTLLGAD